MAQASNDLPIPKEDPASPPEENAPAASIIRHKLDRLYEKEPEVKAEESEISKIGAQSKHQKFIEKLMTSGSSLVDIQTAWHNYYHELPDDEKHKVWQEFYENNNRSSKYYSYLAKQQPAIEKPSKPLAPEHTQHQTIQHLVGSIESSELEDGSSKPQSTATIKQHLLNTVTSQGKIKKRQHLQSLIFGLCFGFLVLFIFMFSFFNERFIAPFITPSRDIGNTNIIVDAASVGPDPVVIIPKINVDIPVVYNVTGIDETSMDNGLLNGAVHYPYSPLPGQDGNVVVVGHSSNNIFNPGKYKFAFVLLHDLQDGDTFMLNYHGTQYVYKVYEHKVVSRFDVSILGPSGQTATASLITCDPPGTALNRLVVLGEQISPSISKNTAASTITPTKEPTVVPGNSESLFERLIHSL